MTFSMASKSSKEAPRTRWRLDSFNERYHDLVRDDLFQS